MTEERNRKNIIPKVGDYIVFYGKGLGFEVDGLQINNEMVYYRTEDQKKVEYDAWVKTTDEEYRREYAKLMEKIKDEESFETGNISGMGGGYERCVQLALRAGVKWLREHPDFKFRIKIYKDIYGIARIDTMGVAEYEKLAKELDGVLLKAADNDLTGAMHQAIITHLSFIHQHSEEKWLSKFKSEDRYTYPQGLPPTTLLGEEASE